MPETVVVNIREVGTAPDSFDVFIGRPSMWGNPYKVGRDGNRGTVLAKYRDYVLGRADLMAALPELKGKRLACFCAPKGCHGDILVELIYCKKPTGPGHIYCADCLDNKRKKTLSASKLRRAEQCCADCGRPSEPYRCSECADRHNSYSASTGIRNKAEGKCRCGNTSVPGRSQCFTCNERSRSHYRVARARHGNANDKARHARWRANQIAKGLCTQCADGQPEEGYRRCNDCREKERIRGNITMTKRRSRRNAEHGNPDPRVPDRYMVKPPEENEPESE